MNSLKVLVCLVLLCSFVVCKTTKKRDDSSEEQDHDEAAEHQEGLDALASFFGNDENEGAAVEEETIAKEEAVGTGLGDEVNDDTGNNDQPAEEEEVIVPEHAGENGYKRDNDEDEVEEVIEADHASETGGETGGQDEGESESQAEDAFSNLFGIEENEASKY